MKRRKTRQQVAVARRKAAYAAHCAAVDREYAARRSKEERPGTRQDSVIFLDRLIDCRRQGYSVARAAEELGSTPGKIKKFLELRNLKWRLL